MTTHTYATTLAWEGSTSQGHRHYSRAHAVHVDGVAAALPLSADPAFRGDPTRLNPELLVVAAASSCQLLSFLALAAGRGVDVLAYDDAAEGVMDDAAEPARISRIVLRPRVVVAPGSPVQDVVTLAHEAHDLCYVASSLNSEVELDVRVVVR